MDIKKLQAIVIEALENVKASDIVMFDTSKLTSMYDRVVIASGTSNRQTKALAASVRDKVREAGGKVIGMEGENAGEWVLVDLGDLVVHIMQTPIRAYYQLEEIWGGKPVDLEKAKKALKPKAAPRRKAVKKDEPKAPEKRATAKKAASATAKAKTAKAPAGKKTTAAKTAASGKTAAKKKTAG